MRDDEILWRAGVWHVALLATLLVILAGARLPVRGAAAGGLAMGLSAVLLWAGVRTVVTRGRRSLGTALAVLKVAFYLGLASAALRGWMALDGAGFAAGVSCFPLATVAAVVERSRRRGTDARARWSTGFPGWR